MILDRLFHNRICAATKLGPYHVSHPGGDLVWGGMDDVSGERVDETSALGLSAVFCAINLISSTLGVLPMILYRRMEDDQKERATTHPLYRLLHDAPNPEMSAFTFKQTLQAHVLGWGNGYAEIERLNSGEPAALWPLTPDRVSVKRTRGDKRVVYDVWTGERNDTLEAEDVYHVAGLGYDGLQGYSIVGLARQCIGLGMAAEKFGAAFFGNAARPSGAIKLPGKVSDKALANLKLSLKEQRQGAKNAASVMVLEEGMDWAQFTIPPDDAQFLETRQFSVVDIARWFNIPPTKLKDLRDTKYATVEYHALEYQTDTMLPWETRWEQESDRKLLAESEREDYFARFLPDAILRTDIKTRYDAYSVGLNNGFMSPDDVRAREDMNALPNGAGKIYLRNSALSSAESFMPGNTAQPSERPPVEPDEESEDVDDLRAAIAAAHAGVIGDAIRRMSGMAMTALGRGKEIEKYLEGFAPKVRLALMPGFESLGASLAATGKVPADWSERVASATGKAAKSVTDFMRGLTAGAMRAGAVIDGDEIATRTARLLVDVMEV